VDGDNPPAGVVHQSALSPRHRRLRLRRYQPVLLRGGPSPIRRYCDVIAMNGWSERWRHAADGDAARSNVRYCR
jgi:hypothetical protein